MKHLVLYAHPDKKSFSHSLKEKVVASIKARGEEVIVRDLYEMNFNAVRGMKDIDLMTKNQVCADVLEEQKLIKAADVITVIHPIWWAGMPAILKGYIDRVFTHGFAYAVENGGLKPLLSGKKVIMINNHGAPNEHYAPMQDAIKMTEDQGIFKFCGMEILNHQFFGAVPYVENSAREKWLESVAAIFKGL